jgi:hypothetical protein
MIAICWFASFNVQAATGVTSMGFEVTVLRDLGIVIEYEASADPLLTGPVALSFSAKLRNIGTSAVLWKWSIEPAGAADNVGEHPFLALHMYRILNGRITQIGRADVKHAFYAGNNNCSSAGGQIIYPTCEDNYTATTNSNRLYMAPREEVTAGTGAWTRVGSHFDGGGTVDFRDHQGDAEHDDFEHRLVVAGGDL